MTSKQSPAKQAYDKKYNAEPAHLKEREQRNKARAIVEKKVGDLPSTVDVDHRKMIKDGGGNTDGNLRAVSEKKNSGWRKGVKGYG